jgi:hypothetical protein
MSSIYYIRIEEDLGNEKHSFLESSNFMHIASSREKIQRKILSAFLELKNSTPRDFLGGICFIDRITLP